MIESAARQLWLEIRRNEYRWFFLAVAIGTALALTDRLSAPVVFWSDVTLAWRDTLYILGPWTAAAAAWTAGRERRHGLDDLLSTTARSPFRRRIGSLAAVSVLAVGAFALIGGWMALTSVQRIAWGHLDWSIIVIAVMSILAAALFGFAAGAWKPRRATAFIIMIGLALLQLILAGSGGWQSFLTATPNVRNSIWSGITPDKTGIQFFLYVGLIGIGLTLVATRADRGWLSRGVMAASAIVAVLAVASLTGQDDAIRSDALASDSNGTFISAPGEQSFTMICTDSITAVCVHPAFEPMLADSSDRINALISALGRPAESPERVNLIPATIEETGERIWTFPLTAADPQTDLDHALSEIDQRLVASKGASLQSVTFTNTRVGH